MSSTWTTLYKKRTHINDRVVKTNHDKIQTELNVTRGIVGACSRFSGVRSPTDMNFIDISPGAIWSSVWSHTHVVTRFSGFCSPSDADFFDIAGPRTTPGPVWSRAHVVARFSVGPFPLDVDFVHGSLSAHSAMGMVMAMAMAMATMMVAMATGIVNTWLFLVSNFRWSLKRAKRRHHFTSSATIYGSHASLLGVTDTKHV